MPGDLPDAVAALLLDMELSEEERESINPFWLIDLELPIERCPVWARAWGHADGLFRQAVSGPAAVAMVALRLPPPFLFRSSCHGSAWGAPDGPLGRCSTLRVAYHCGIPSAWVDAEDAEWLTAESTAAIIDPADPPIYEAQAAYLSAMACSLRRSDAGCRPDAFEPESVT